MSRWYNIPFYKYAIAKLLIIKTKQYLSELTCHIFERRFLATADKMGIEGYHNYTTGLRL